MSGPYDLFGTALEDLERASLALLDRAISHYRPAKVWALFSGGTDSTASALLASKHPAFSGALHLVTGTGVPETLAHVQRICSARGWDLLAEPPRTTSYEALVTSMGFPGRPKHGAAYAALKDRALKRVTAKKRAGSTVLLIAGARTQESRRRMANARLLTEKPGDNRVWINPILHWPKEACRDYAARHGVAESPVSRAMGMSGECMCGAFAAPGERDLLRLHYPAHEEWISWLERKVEAAGRWPHWGVQAPKGLDRWPHAPEFDFVAPMCTDCERRAA